MLRMEKAIAFLSLIYKLIKNKNLFFIDYICKILIYKNIFTFFING